jgi:hypothetical protein
MLVIARPPHRASDRLRTSLAVARPISGFGCGALASGTGVGWVSAGVGGGSVSAAICGAGGLNRGVYGTGARPLPIVAGAVDLWAGEMAADCALAVTSNFGAEGGAKMAALAVPAKTRKARANPICFIEANPV